MDREHSQVNSLLAEAANLIRREKKAEMIVAIAGEILRMPGLPKEPQALHIDIVDGEIEGLS